MYCTSKKTLFNTKIIYSIKSVSGALVKAEALSSTISLWAFSLFPISLSFTVLSLSPPSSLYLSLFLSFHNSLFALCMTHSSKYNCNIYWLFRSHRSFCCSCLSNLEWNTLRDLPIFRKQEKILFWLYYIDVYSRKLSKNLTTLGLNLLL